MKQCTPTVARVGVTMSWRHKGTVIYLWVEVGYLNFIETANNNDFLPRVERRKSKPMPAYNYSPFSWRFCSIGQAQVKQKGKSIIYFAHAKHPNNIVDSERTRLNVLLSVRDGFRSIKLPIPAEERFAHGFSPDIEQMVFQQQRFLIGKKKDTNFRQFVQKLNLNRRD